MTLNGASAITAVGNITAPQNGNAAITNSSSYGGTITLPFGAGINSFGALTDNDTTASNMLTLAPVAGSMNIFSNLTGSATTAAVKVNGNATSVVDFAVGGSSSSPTVALTVAGGSTIFSGDRFMLATSGETLNITGGTLVGTGGYGFRFGSSGGAGSANGGNVNVTITQSGGLAIQLGHGLELGGNTTGITDTYTLSGGTLDVGTLWIGAFAGGAGNTTFNLQGGTLLVPTAIQQGTSNGAGSAAVFTFSGGTLAAAAVNMTDLVNTGTVASAGTLGTLTQTGGIIAPGNIGYSGITAITGGFSMNGSSTMEIGLGGGTASSAFQDTGLGKFGQITVAGTGATATLTSATLIPYIMPGYNATAGSGASYWNILQTPKAVNSFTGTGSYFANNSVVNTNEGFSTVTVTTTAGSASVFGGVSLGTYAITSQWIGTGNWDGTTTRWTGGADENSTSSGAYFGTTGAGGAVTLAESPTVHDITFNDSASPYTISTANASTITLNSSAAGTATAGNAILSDIAGSATINPNMTFSAPVNAGAASGVTLTLAGQITDASSTLMVTGAGTVALTGNNTGFTAPITIASGILQTDTAGINAVSNTSGITISGGTLKVNTSAGITLNSADPITVGVNAATLDITNGNMTFNAPLIYGGAGGVVIAGGNTNSVTLNAVDSFSGGVTINGGNKLSIGNVGALNPIPGLENAVTFGASSTGILTLNGYSLVIANLQTNATPGAPVVQNANATPAILTVGNSGAQRHLCRHDHQRLRRRRPVAHQGRRRHADPLRRQYLHRLHHHQRRRHHSRSRHDCRNERCSRREFGDYHKRRNAES